MVLSTVSTDIGLRAANLCTLLEAAALPFASSFSARYRNSSHTHARAYNQAVGHLNQYHHFTRNHTGSVAHPRQTPPIHFRVVSSPLVNKDNSLGDALHT